MRVSRSVLRGAGLGLAVALLAAAPVQALPADDVAPVVDTSAIPSDTPSPVDSPTAAASLPADPSPPAPSPAGPPPVDLPTPGSTVTPQVTVGVSADSAVLTDQYWSGQTTAVLHATATNLGTVTEVVTFAIPHPPAGIQSASCGRACSITLAPGATKTVTITVRVAPDAWKLAPLTGSLGFTATAPGAASRSGTIGWGVVFPPGPPTPGIQLHVGDVHLQGRPTDPSTLRIQTTNSGAVTGTATVTAMVPSGVTFGSLQAGCQKLRATAVRCVGTVDPGQTWVVQVPLQVPDHLRAQAPLVGLVKAVLQLSGQDALLTQASYQIFAPPGESGVTVGASTPPGSGAPNGSDLHDRAAGPLDRSVVVWPIISGSLLLLVVVVIGFIVILRRRREELVAIQALQGSARLAIEPESEPEQSDRTAVISAGPVDRTPSPRGPIAWEWVTGEEALQPRPAGDPEPAEEIDTDEPESVREAATSAENEDAGRLDEELADHADGATQPATAGA
jgi:hypothetical protein